MDHLINTYANIMVNRKGKTEDSHMQTIKIIGQICPNETYTIESNNLYLSEAQSQSQSQSRNPCINRLKKIKSKNNIKEPLYTKIKNKWNCYHQNNLDVNSDNNILGTNGEFQIDSNLTIPLIETTSENLEFYNCTLICQHDRIKIDSPKKIPLTVMQIGSNYAKDYLLTEIGGGCYLEYHDVPHFHMPLNKNSSGYLILGKIIDGYCCLSAFAIPYTYAIYTAPFTIHCDAFLVGDYMVAYTVTENYSTVLLKNDGNIVDVNFI